MNKTEDQNGSIERYIAEVTRGAASAKSEIGRAETDTKNLALKNVAEQILASGNLLRKENSRDLKEGKDRGLNAALLDRLELNDNRIQAMADGVEQVARLPDPVGQTTPLEMRPSGIRVGKMRVAIGVILIIYESRPNVTADAAALCIKSGNATILRGGSEALHSNRAIAACIHAGLEQAGLSRDIVQIINTTDRDAVGKLLQSRRHIDLVIPRGGKGLIERISRESQIPLLKHLDGVCHVYVHEDANTTMAVEIAVNAKAQRFGVCNAMETLLVDRAIAESVLPEIRQRLELKAVELRGCTETCSLLPGIAPATEQDWHEEYLAPVLAVRIVGGISQAVEHIRTYGSHHTDAIVTDNDTAAQQFLRCVDSSSVMVNASTRFADGFEYGLGAEIGISTDKLHARGPVGLEGLTSEKFIVLGNGNIRE